MSTRFDENWREMDGCATNTAQQYSGLNVGLYSLIWRKFETQSDCGLNTHLISTTITLLDSIGRAAR